MNIIGERITLRAIELDDNELLKNIMNDANTEHELGGWSFPISSLIQEEWIKSQSKTQGNGILRSIICDNDNLNAMGTLILSDIDYKNGNAEVHIKLVSDARGKGYGSSALRTIVDYAFSELRLNCLYAHINAYNEKSQILFQNVGFVKEGTLRNRIFKAGKFHDVLVFSILNE